VSGFEVLSHAVVDGNEVVQVSAIYSADIFTSDAGAPGGFLGHLSMPGTVHFLYAGRDPSVNPLGTFDTELTDFAFSGMLNGNTFAVTRNPAHTSGGSTTILPVPAIPRIAYEVSGSLEIFALYSFNGSPFLPAPPRTAELSQVPEPASGVVAAVILLAAGVASRRRRCR
jgi:hypothetical protein